MTPADLSLSRSLVTIDGRDGSGKSTFARALADACEREGAPAHVFHVDDFRRPLGALPEGADEASAYYQRYFDFALLDACLARFLGGAASVSIPRFDAGREVVDGTLELHFEGARLAFLEGVFPLRAPTAAAAPLVLLEVSETEARRRVLARDFARGRPRDLIEHRMDKRYFPAQRAYRGSFDPLRRADVVVDNESWERPRLVRLLDGRLPWVVEKALGTIIRP